jgi:hypothetical protein
MYAKDPRDGWHPLMRQMPDQLIDLTPYELEYAKSVAESMSQRGGMF